MRILFTICLLCLSIFSFSQTYKVSLQAQTEFKVEEQKIRIADGFLDYDRKFNGATAWYNSHFSIKLTKYDNDMKMVKELVLQNGDKAFGPFNFKVQYMGNKLYLYYFQMAEDDKDADINVFAVEINTAELTLGTPVKVLTLSQKNGRFSWKPTEATMTNLFTVMQSPDKSKTLVFWTPNLEDGNYYFSVLDADNNVLREYTGSIKELEEPEIYSVCVDNLGNVFIGYLGVQKKKMFMRVIVSAPDKNSKEAEIPRTDGFPQTICLQASKTGNLVHIGGTYGTGYYFNGVYHATISAALPELSAVKQFPLPDSILKQISTHGWGTDKTPYAAQRFYNPLPYELEDGSFGMAAEFKKGFTNLSNTMTATGFTQAYPHTVSGDILNIRFDGDKGIVASCIPKYRLTGLLTLGQSYCQYILQNKVFFFYADNEENLSRPMSGNILNSNKTTELVLLVASVDEAGNIKREKLVDKKDENFLPAGEYGTTYPGDKGILYLPLQKARTFDRVAQDAMWAKIEIPVPAPSLKEDGAVQRKR